MEFSCWDIDDSPVKDKLKKVIYLIQLIMKNFSASEFIATLRTYNIGETVSIGLHKGN
jgi:hypothetical protein